MSGSFYQNPNRIDIPDLTVIPPEPNQPQQPPPVPSYVTMMQARIALAQANQLTAVNNQVATMDQETQLMWEYSGYLRRDHPKVIAIAQSLGLDLPALFTAAATIS
jgi:hypothetical protein